MNYPKGEIVCVSHYDKHKNLKYITTTKPTGGLYYLYELKEGKFTKLGKDENPLNLEEKFIRY